MQGDKKICFLVAFCIMVISFYPASAQYKCLSGEADLDSSTNKTVTAPTDKIDCTSSVAFCMTEDNGNCIHSISLK